MTARGREQRQRILDAASRVFIEHGFAASSVRDIAAAAGLTHQGVLRHFASKDHVLDALVARYESANVAWFEAAVRDPDPLGFVHVARHNLEQPGYTELFTTLAGESGRAPHPAHRRITERYRAMRAAAAEQFETVRLRPGLDPVGESVRLLAAWDGLQVVSLYLPETVDVAAALERRRAYLLGTALLGAPEPVVPHPPVESISMSAALVGDEDLEGYSVGRARRGRIVADAMRLFAERGFAETSMRDIARSVGVSKSTLFHHYATKDDLLAAVLRARDHEIAESVAGAEALSGAAALRMIPDGARANAVLRPGLIEMYAVLSCEATALSHPAHDYFRDRFVRSLRAFEGVLAVAAADGQLRAGADPAFEALWLVALWDGLQFQWLHDPDAVDVADHLAAHIDGLLVPQRR